MLNKMFSRRHAMLMTQTLPTLLTPTQSFARTSNIHARDLAVSWREKERGPACMRLQALTRASADNKPLHGMADDALSIMIMLAFASHRVSAISCVFTR